MNESFPLHGSAGLNTETNRLGGVAQRWDGVFLVGNRSLYWTNEALGVLLGGLCFGLLGLLLFILALCHKKINTRHLTVFKVSLVVSGLLQSLSTPDLAMALLGTICSLRYCYKLGIIWVASRRCGTLLHLLVTLEYLLTWRQPHEGSKVVPVYLSVPFVLVLDLVCVLFSDVLEATVALGAMASTLTLIVCFSACYNRGGMDRRRLSQVSWTAFLSFGLTYFPIFVMECRILMEELISPGIYYILLCMSNLRLIADAYLCWITCKETEEAPRQMEPREVVSLPYIRQARM